MRQGLGTLELWVAEDDGALKGFMGMHANTIEALFLDPACIGKKLGTRFIEHAKGLLGRDAEVRVNVNEQNSKALVFYLAKGFKQTGRSDTDSAGRPWPLLHLVLPPA